MEKIKPQKGFQQKFLSSGADVVIGGGMAGAGKTFSLLMEAARRIKNPDYSGQIFRRTTTQIRNTGAIWDESMKFYTKLGGSPAQHNLTWTFQSGATLKFSHLEHEKNIYDHQGGQYEFLAFDELTHFTEKMFFYLLGRNRSVSGKPYCRTTCNPDPDSWVAEFIKWWIDQDTGYPIPERDGVIRYFVNDSGRYIWGDTKEEVKKIVPHLFEGKNSNLVSDDDKIKSVTFIAGDIYDNHKLLEQNPEYIGNLMALDPEEKLRLLGGNWKATQNDEALFKHSSLEKMFNEPIESDESNCVTADVAGEGDDLAVVIGWEGMNAKYCEILTKCKQPELQASIEKVRNKVNVSPRDCIVDYDGIGVGVVDYGGYSGFKNGGSPISPRKAKKDDTYKADYKNIKTQCYYKIAERINMGELSFYGCEYYVDGQKTDTIKRKGGTYRIQKVIERELRAIKKKDRDMDNKKQINSKREQKESLSGESPDFADTIMMRARPLIEVKTSFVLDNF